MQTHPYNIIHCRSSFERKGESKTVVVGTHIVARCFLAHRDLKLFRINESETWKKTADILRVLGRIHSRRRSLFILNALPQNVTLGTYIEKWLLSIFAIFILHIIFKTQFANEKRFSFIINAIQCNILLQKINIAYFGATIVIYVKICTMNW